MVYIKNHQASMMSSIAFILFIAIGKERINAQELESSNNTSDQNEIEKTFQLLSEGDSKIELSEQYKNVTFLVGNTGSGKSTLIQWIVDSNNVFSKEVRPDSEVYIIEDGQKRIGSSVFSFTTFPELVIDNKTNAALYDCPGFSDTRSSSNDIANNYFIKKVTDHSTNVKIVLVLIHSSVTQGNERTDFVTLLRHITTFVKDIEKYRDSFGVVVTKVNNVYKKKGRYLVPDEITIETIADQFKDVQKDFSNKSMNADVSTEEKAFLENAIKLLDILLTVQNQNYTRIAIFRKPDEEGPLSKITILEEGKRRVETLIYQELKFTGKSDHDFGYTISDASKNAVHNLVEKINEKVWWEVSKICEKVQEHFENLFQAMYRKFNSLHQISETVDFQNEDVRNFTFMITAGLQELSGLVAESMTSVKLKDSSKALQVSILNRLEIQACENNTEHILQQGRYLDFLEDVSGKEFSTKPWTVLFEKVEISLTRKKDLFHRDVNTLVENINNEVWSEVSKICDKVQKHFENLFENMHLKINSFLKNSGTGGAPENDVRNFESVITAGLKVLSGMVAESKRSVKIKDLLKAIQSSILSLLETHACDDNIEQISRQGRFLEFLEIVSGKKLGTKPWTVLFKQVETFLIGKKEHFQQDVNALAENINEKAWLEVSKIRDKVQKHFENLFQTMDRKIYSFLQNLGTVDAQEDDARNFESVITVGSQELSRLVAESKRSVKLKDFSRVIQSSILNRLAIHVCTDNIENILQQGRYLEFLEDVNGKELGTRPWALLCEQVETFVTGKKQVFIRDVHALQLQIIRLNENFMENIGNSIVKFYENQIVSTDIENAPMILDEGSDMVSYWIDETCRRGDTWKKLSIEISYSKIASSSIISDALSFSKYANYFMFLNAFNRFECDMNCNSTWILPLRNVHDNLADLEVFMIFANDLYNKFSEFDIQANKSKYNVADLNDWGSEGKSQGIRIEPGNFEQFMEKCKSIGLEGFHGVKKIKVTEFYIKVLNQILGYLLGSSFDQSCSGPGKLLIRGDYIQFSDFVTPDGKISHLCGYNLTHVEVFGSSVVFIDRDLRENGLQLTIIAPKWEIIGNRVINLDGVTGFQHEHPAKEGDFGGGSGADGLPGLPGKPGGNFFGISGKVVNGQKLIISACGGQGGQGQQGGVGGEGRKGKNAELKVDIVHDTEYTNYIARGKSGGYGGTGGNGGKGGLGGFGGKIMVLPLYGNNILAMTRNENGPDGIEGNGGNGGLAGFNGDDLTYTVIEIPFWQKYRNLQRVEVTDRLYHGNGKAGSAGSSKFNEIVQPQEGKPFQNIPETVRSNKNYLLQKLKNYLTTNSLLDFARKLDSNVVIKMSYDTLSLIDEFQELVRQHSKKHENLDVLFLYKSLLKRTRDYAKNPKHYENSESYRIALGHLYAATLSKISNFNRKSSESGLITDLEIFLNLVKKNINDFSEVNEKSIKLKVINQLRDAYETKIDIKIKEALYLIESQVTPEINKIHAEIQIQTDLLINEIIVMQEGAKNEKDALIRKKRELENAIVLGWVSSVFSIFGAMLSCFGGVGFVLGATMAVSQQISNNIVISQIQNVKGTFVSVKDQQLNHFKIVLATFSTEVQKNPELGETSEKISSITSRLHDKTSAKELKKLKKELKTEALRQKIILKNQGSGEMIKRAEATIIKLSVALDLGAIGLNIYQKYENDKKQIETIDDAIQQAENNIQQLEDYETQLYEEIIPVLDDTVQNLNNLADQLENKSQVALDVTQWQVQSFLKTLQMQMRQFTKGLSVEENLARCIDKLDETMTTLIHLYDRIQGYEEQHDLAVYIADISSPTAINVDIANQTLSSAVSELDIVINSNLILEQHQTAVNALIQHVFPFASYYLNDFRLAKSDLPHDGSLQNLVSEAIAEVDGLHSKMIEYKSSVTKHDRFLSSGWFNRDYTSADPFFVWENSEYQDEIFKLLSGEKIVLKADILKGVLTNDAIKFNKIDLSFYSDNASLTSEISKKLDGFKISATHLGNSYYKYNNKIYVISSDNQNILFSFEKDEHGEPVHKNRVYEKIQAGDLMLSPYAMWEFQLIVASKNVYFRDLQMYKDSVNVELVGYGSYVTKGTNMSDFDLDPYYKLAETIY